MYFYSYLYLIPKYLFLNSTTTSTYQQIVTLPSMLLLMNYLEDIKSQLRYYLPICRSLMESIKFRFQGMLQHTWMRVSDPTSKARILLLQRN